MDNTILEEQLREAACEGDEAKVYSLIQRGVNINSQHKFNGWTCLHWAVKRGHVGLVSYLVSMGADKNIVSAKNDRPCDLTNDLQILKLLGVDLEVEKKGLKSNDTGFQNNLPITPNYLVHPKFPYVNLASSNPGQIHSGNSSAPNVHVVSTGNELVLKVRVALSMETDFIEVEMDMSNRTFDNLTSIMCTELGVNRSLIQKIRKLPDTIIRKDKDVMRLKEFQELELVLTNKAMSAATRNYSGLLPTQKPTEGAIIY